ncbi:hypothetical protein GCM10010199_35060 [Dactylosporangium roseum]
MTTAPGDPPQAAYVAQPPTVSRRPFLGGTPPTGDRRAAAAGGPVAALPEVTVKLVTVVDAAHRGRGRGRWAEASKGQLRPAGRSDEMWMNRK